MGEEFGDLDTVAFYTEDGEAVEFYVLEQTRIAGVNYILVTDQEEGDGEALILKDLSAQEEEESVYEIVSDEEELEAVAVMFDGILDDVEFVTED
ncbi:MAG: DUF1292 domain-containing protein [Lachnospiraceae bacterium]